jgi:hypothetical protein
VPAVPLIRDLIRWSAQENDDQIRFNSGAGSNQSKWRGWGAAPACGLHSMLGKAKAAAGGPRLGFCSQVVKKSLAAWEE